VNSTPSSRRRKYRVDSVGRPKFDSTQVDVKEDEKTSAAAVPIHPAPDFDSPLGLLRRDSSFKLPGLT
jgi:hypothetical protein